MTTYLPVLLLLDLGGPGTATALQIDAYSASGIIQPVFTTGGEASFTVTAPDFRLGVGFASLTNFDPTIEFVGFRCFAPGTDFPRDTCRPGDRMTARAHAFGTDVTASISLAGQGIPPCFGHNMRPLDPSGHLCASAGGSTQGPHASLSWGGVTLPVFAGPPPGHPTPNVPPNILNLATVASTFSADIGVSIWDSSLPGSSSVRIDGVGFTGSGPAQFVLEWRPATGTWTPLFAEGRFEVETTPEPASLLLFGTTAAGLGLARWYRRRASERSHAT